jgi:hypothetical protein
VTIPITDVDPLRIALAWREHQRSPLVDAYAQVVREVAESQRLGVGGAARSPAP